MTRILVVDDEPNIRFIVRKMLEGAGYIVSEAWNAKECLYKLSQERVDLVLMDVLMPEMDGWELTRQIKEKEETKNIPVAMLTVISWAEGISESFREAHADAHIEKPIDKERMLKTIEGLLEHKLAVQTQYE